MWWSSYSHVGILDSQVQAFNDQTVLSRICIKVMQQDFISPAVLLWYWKFFLLIQSMKIQGFRGLRETKVCLKALDTSLRRLFGYHLYWEIGQVAWKEPNSECISMVCSLRLSDSPSPCWALEFCLTLSRHMSTHTHTNTNTYHACSFIYSKTNITIKCLKLTQQKYEAQECLTTFAKACATFLFHKLSAAWQFMSNSLLSAETLPWSGLVSSCACFLAVCFLNVALGALTLGGGG